jgi:hypothetical protein
MLEAGKSEVAEGNKLGSVTWVVTEDDNQSTIQMKQVDKDAGGKEHSVQFTCDIGGKECSFEDLDGKAKASFWYNGPMLVEMRTGGHHGDAVSKYRMRLSDDGKTMTVEVTPIMPASEKPEKLVFTKQN